MRGCRRDVQRRARLGVADVGLSYRFDKFQVGLETGVWYSVVPSYVADVGPNLSGLMTSTGIAAGFEW